MAELDWKRVREVFDAACEMETAQRAAFVGQACGDDDKLRAEVERLLRAHAEAGDFIEQPALAMDGAAGADEPTSELTLELGEQRIGPYRILRELGRGGMGVVFLAERADGEFRKQVAIKLLPHGADADEIHRFRRERQILADLDHPNIARLIDGGALDGRPYVVMEFVAGQSLRELLRAPSALSLEQTLAIARQVCAGLEAAHRCGVVHRDIKPENLIVGERDGELLVKILDFGIAKLDAATIKTRTGVIIGTVIYMSPEQAAGVSGDQVDARSDIYSLGVVVYEMLTGRPVFEGDSYVSVLYQHQHAQPTPPHELPSGKHIPPAVSRVILRALAKDRAERQQSAKQLADELEDACRDNAPPPVSFTPRAQSRLTKAVLLTAGIIALVFAAWFAAKRWAPSQMKPAEASVDQAAQQPANATSQLQYRTLKKGRAGEDALLRADDAVRAGDEIHFEITMPFAGHCYLFYEDRDGSLVWANPRPDQPPQRGQAGERLRVPESGWIPFENENPRKQIFIAVYVPDDVLWSLEDIVLKDELKVHTKDVTVPYARIQAQAAARLTDYLNQHARQMTFTTPAVDGVWSAPVAGAAPRRVIFHHITVWHAGRQ